MTQNDEILGQVLEGKYRLDAVLGSGGMGRVYRAVHVQLDREVAVKILRSGHRMIGELRERFRREARAVARLKHPHIVTIYDFGVATETGAYLVMELVNGRSLRDLIRSRRRFPADEAIELMTQVCSALQAAHSGGVIHRDLKPENIIVETTAAGRFAKVVDFGIAKLHQESGDDAPELTQGGLVLGTPAYMSPEQANGLQIDARTDVYALGCILYELLAGRPPFLGPTTAATLFMHSAEPPPPLERYVEGVDPVLARVVYKALAKSARERFASAALLGRALCEAGGVVPALFPTPVDDAHNSVHTASDLPTMVSGGVTRANAMSPDSQPNEPPNNLPSEINSFVGRSAELTAISNEVRGSRLVTLAGPGGVGKTRLALRAATDLLDEFPDGVWLVELASLGSPDLIANAVASACGVRETTGSLLVEAIARYLQDRRTLLVLDNCEHVVGACAELVERLLRACPQLQIIATSREPLRVSGEAVRPLGTLGVPTNDVHDVEQLVEFDAVKLFVDRARARRPDFAITPANAKSIVSLCRALEGIPLALELAAARAGMLSVEQILARMSDRFGLLVEGGRTAAERQRTLRGALDWSYELLPLEERALWRQMSVFPGGWTLESAEAVGARCGAEEDALELLSALVDKSIVGVEFHSTGSRYRMLEAIREYGELQLHEEGQAESMRRELFDWACGFAHSSGEAKVPIFVAEHDNLGAALKWGLEHDPQAAHVLCNELAWYWERGCLYHEGLMWLRSALERNPQAAPATRAATLRAIASILEKQGAYAPARAMLEEALGLQRKAGESGPIILTLHILGHVLEKMGEHTISDRVRFEFLQLAREMSDSTAIAVGLNELGLSALARNDLQRASTLIAQSLDHYAPGDRLNRAVALHNIGDIALREGHLPLAADRLAESIQIGREISNGRLTAYSSHLLAYACIELKELDRARDCLSEALRIHREMGDKDGVAASIEGYARLVLGSDPALALRLAGAATALRASIDLKLTTWEHEAFERLVDTARAAIDAEDAETAYRAGLAMSVEAATDLTTRVT